MRRPTFLLLAFAATACASNGASARGAPGPHGWVATEHRDHPLVGRIWDVRAASFVDERALDAAVAGADFVLLGEIHDNPDHHLWQARLVRSIVASGRRPVLAFEMLDTSQQPAVDAALAAPDRSADGLARAVDWEHGGWPEFSMYRPVFAAGVDGGLPIVAANFPRRQMSAIVKQGPDALTPAVRALLDRAGPPSPDEARALREEMRESHCGELPDAMLEPLVLAQRARDAQMADRLLASGDRGAILVTGGGHARTDRGVPAYLAREAPGKTVVSVGLLEVSPDAKQPQDYAEAYGTGRLPFDYVLFTPGAAREDPCEQLRERMKMHKPPPPATRAER